jgi:protein arginine kinase activator
MKCERCNVNPATHHYKKSVNGAVTEKYLCASCASAENMPFKIFTGGAVFPSFIAPFSAVAAGPSVETVKCAACGTTLREFNETAYLGCRHCYDELKPYLEPVIKKLHGGGGHTGRIPRLPRGSKSAAPDTRALDRARLVRQLEKAIEDEAFEEAARLRDQIRKMDSGGKQ